MAIKEYRINLKDSLQGHYILAHSERGAVKHFREHHHISKEDEPLGVHLWKTKSKGSSYPNKLTAYARRRMKLTS